ncbi:hypothetical protein IMCC20628_03083 [Hoeflea sp. IMCC20628]|nr:hypothetical protein IMCC20628_03083 [Hoeflea sp. IMCC20628]
MIGVPSDPVDATPNYVYCSIPNAPNDTTAFHQFITESSDSVGERRSDINASIIKWDALRRHLDRDQLLGSRELYPGCIRTRPFQ